MAKVPSTTVAKPKSQPENSTEEASIEVELERRIETVLSSSNLSRVQKEQVVGQVVSIVRAEKFSGPLPHPRHLEAYDRVVPGGAERILAMTEQARSHNESMEAKIVACEVRDRHIGMGLGFVALMLLVGLAFYAGMNDKTVLAGLLLGTAAISAVVAFIKGRNSV